MKDHKKSFTLVELLLVIGCFAVMAVLIGVGCDSGSSGSSGFGEGDSSASRRNCENNLNQIGKALMQYSQDNNENMPNGIMAEEQGDYTVTNNVYTRDRAGVEAVFNVLRFGGYLTDGNVYVCPSSDAKAEKDAATEMKIAATDGTLSYAYSYVSGYSYTDSAISGDLTHIDSEDKNANHTGYGNLLFFDGHVKGFNGVGWCSQSNTGYTEFSDSGMTVDDVLPPNTLRNETTGK